MLHFVTSFNDGLAGTLRERNTDSWDNEKAYMKIDGKNNGQNILFMIIEINKFVVEIIVDGQNIRIKLM